MCRRAAHKLSSTAVRPAVYWRTAGRAGSVADGSVLGSSRRKTRSGCRSGTASDRRELRLKIRFPKCPASRQGTQPKQSPLHSQGDHRAHGGLRPGREVHLPVLGTKAALEMVHALKVEEPIHRVPPDGQSPRATQLSPLTAVAQRTAGISDKRAVRHSLALQQSHRLQDGEGDDPRVASARRRYISTAHIVPARQGLQTTKASIREPRWATKRRRWPRPCASKRPPGIASPCHEGSRRRAPGRSRPVAAQSCRDTPRLSGLASISTSRSPRACSNSPGVGSTRSPCPPRRSCRGGRSVLRRTW